MKISTEINSIAKIVGMPRAVELCGKAGFDAWDFSLFDMCLVDKKTKKPLGNESPLNGRDYLKFAKELKRIGLDNAMVCNQSHAPFPVYVPEIRRCLERAIECTAEAGGEICVIHPDNNKTAEQNAEMYAELLPFAKACGVKIAAENMWNWDHDKNQPTFAACATSEDFKKHIDIINDDFLVACLDIGHAEMRSTGDGAVNMIKALDYRLKALHIHDNDCFLDHHQLPFSMSINFEAVVKALREVNYRGYFTLEANMFLANRNEDNLFDGVLEMRQCASRLADMFDKA